MAKKVTQVVPTWCGYIQGRDGLVTLRYKLDNCQKEGFGGGGSSSPKGLRTGVVEGTGASASALAAKMVGGGLHAR